MDTTKSGITPEPNNLPILNQTQISSIRNLDPANGDELANKILHTFLKTSIDLINQIEEAVKKENADDLCHAAHSLKSSAANIGAENLSEITKSMELCGRSRDLVQARQLLDNLQEQYQQATIEIKKLLNQT